MPHPDVITGGREPIRRSRAVLAGVTAFAVAVAAWLIVSLRGHGAPTGTPGAASSPAAVSGAASSPAAVPGARVGLGPDVVLRRGDELLELPSGAAAPRRLAALPAHATDVWATTLPALPEAGSAGGSALPAARTVRVFGLAGGRAFEEDVTLRGAIPTVVRHDLGPADGVLQTQEYPVLVRAGNPLRVASPGSGGVALPAGWFPGRFETLGFAGLLLRPIGAAGDVEIASWSPGGSLLPLTTDGVVLGLTDGGQAVWLDPGCRQGPSCVLFVGDIGDRHPAGGLRAPPGVLFTTDATAALGSGGFAAVTARSATVGAGTTTASGSDTVPSGSLMVVIAPWRGTAVIVPTPAPVAPSVAMFWASGSRLVFGVRAGGGVQLMSYDAQSGHAGAFGPRLDAGCTLLTAFGAPDGVALPATVAAAVPS